MAVVVRAVQADALHVHRAVLASRARRREARVNFTIGACRVSRRAGLRQALDRQTRAVSHGGVEGVQHADLLVRPAADLHGARLIGVVAVHGRESI